MANAVSDSSRTYQWTIKIKNTVKNDECINIGIASYPFAKSLGDCCDGTYDYSSGFNKNEHFPVKLST